jgi:hypothetical protein
MMSVLVLLLALLALVVFQISSEGAAKQSLRRATAALTEIDSLVAGRYDGLQTQAKASAPGDPVQLDDFPVAIELTREDVLDVPQEDLRATILDRSADKLHKNGTSALRESAEAKGSLGLFSVAGFTDRALGMQTSARHTQSAILAGVLFVVGAALVVVTSAFCRGWGRLSAVGVILLVAGAVESGASIGAGLYASAEDRDGNEYLRSELFGIMSDHASLALRDGFAFTIAGALIVAIALVGNAVTARTDESIRAR